MNRMLRMTYIVLILCSILLRFAGVLRPVGYAAEASWRECDGGMIARNFYRGDMNILRPQIDWRKDGPGFVEGEFPIHSWLMAASYRVFGVHEKIGRVINLIASIASIFAFWRLCLLLMTPFQARCALLFFAFSPVLVGFANVVQPDALMLLSTLVCLWMFLAWLDKGRMVDLVFCGLAGALTILLKLPAICIGVGIGLECLDRRGMKILKDWRIWLLAAVMILPAMLWYPHAHQFWKDYGNSLGVSNESHWIGLDMFRDPRELVHYLRGLISIETKHVYGVAGLVLALVGAWRSLRTRRFPLYWILGVYLFYLVAIRTTADDWAIYYHYLSIPAAAILMGLGCFPSRMEYFGNAGFRVPRLDGKQWVLEAASILTVAIFGVQSLRAANRSLERHTPASFFEARAAALKFQPQVEPDALVITIGGPCTDETGKDVAYDDSRMLYWLDRKGFTICHERLGLAAVQEDQAQGAKYFAGNPTGTFAEELAKACERVDGEGAFTLYRLR